MREGCAVQCRVRLIVGEDRFHSLKELADATQNDENHSGFRQLSRTPNNQGIRMRGHGFDIWS